MLGKTFDVLKKNPVLILFYVIAAAVFIGLTVLMMPGKTPEYDQMAALKQLTQILALSIAGGIFGLIFFSGYGNMITEAVVEGSTVPKSFGEGIKKYFVKLFLASLLMLAFYIGFSIVFGIMFAILGVLIVALGSGVSGGIESAATIISMVSMILILFVEVLLLPFILLWIPSLFIDNVGAVESLKRGAKVGVKNYWTLVLVTLVSVVPSTAYGIVRTALMTPEQLAMSAPIDMFASPWYWASTLISSAISIVVVVYIFVLYNEKKRVLEPKVSSVEKQDIPEQNTEE